MAIELLALVDAIDGDTDVAVNIGGKDYRVKASYVLDRANQTGEQAISTVTGLQTALDGKAARFAPTFSSADTAITLSAGQAGGYLQTTAATAVTVTMPPQASVTWETDAEVHIEQAGAGAATIAAGAGVTINRIATATATIAGQYGVVTLKRTAENVWTLFGALGAA